MTFARHFVDYSLAYAVCYTWGDSDVILPMPPSWRYTTVALVLRHKRTYARKLLCKVYTVRRAYSTNNFGVREQCRIYEFHSVFLRVNYTSNMVAGVLRQWRTWRQCTSCIAALKSRRLRCTTSETVFGSWTTYSLRLRSARHFSSATGSKFRRISFTDLRDGKARSAAPGWRKCGRALRRWTVDGPGRATRRRWWQHFLLSYSPSSTSPPPAVYAMENWKLRVVG